MPEYWQCPGCQTVDEVPCWSPEACLVCGTPYEQNQSWPEDDACYPDDPAELDPEVQEQKKAAKKKPHPPFDDCPEGCTERHLFEVFIEAPHYPKPGEALPLRAHYVPVVPEGVDPSLVAEIRPGTASITWKLVGGADLASFDGDEDRVAGTNATRRDVPLTFGAKAQGEVEVELTFHYKGPKDVPQTARLLLPVGLVREPGEREKSRTSKLRCVQATWPVNPYAEVPPFGDGVADDLMRVWHAYDFAVGDADPTGPTGEKIGVPTGFAQKFDRVFRERIGELVELERPEQSADGKVMAQFRRHFYVRGLTDAAGEDQPDEELRASRRREFLYVVEEVYPEKAQYSLEWSALSPSLQRAVNRRGHYLALNDAAAGREKNRAVLVHEVLVHVSDREKSGRELDDEQLGDRLTVDNFRRLVDGLGPYRQSGGVATAAVFFERLMNWKAGSLPSYLAALIQRYEDRESGDQGLIDWVKSQRSNAGGAKNHRFAFFPSGVDAIYEGTYYAGFGVQKYVQAHGAADIRKQRQMADEHVARGFRVAMCELLEHRQQAVFDDWLHALFFHVDAGLSRMHVLAQSIDYSSVEGYVFDHCLGKLGVHTYTKWKQGQSGSIYAALPGRALFYNPDDSPLFGSVSIRVPRPGGGDYSDDDLPWPCD